MATTVTGYSGTPLPKKLGLKEDGIRALALPTGLVDVKVCAVNEDWSGLKLMVRTEKREGWNK